MSVRPIGETLARLGGGLFLDEAAIKLTTVQQVIDHMNVVMNGAEKKNAEVPDHPYPTRQELIVAVASYMNVSAEKAAKWLESEFAAGTA